VAGMKCPIHPEHTRRGLCTWSLTAGFPTSDIWTQGEWKDAGGRLNRETPEISEVAFGRGRDRFVELLNPS